MARYVCTNCNAEYEEKTPDGFCSNQPACEYGSGWLKEVTAEGGTRGPASAPPLENGGGQSGPGGPLSFEREIGLCILMMDGSLSMGETAFPSTGYPGNKYHLVSMNAAGGIWSLKNITRPEDAFIVLCAFAGKPELVWIKNVKEIVAEHKTREAFSEYLYQTLETRTPEPRVTNLNSAVNLAYAIYKAYMNGDLSGFGGIKDFKPLSHKVVRHDGQGGEEYIAIPNARVLIYTDGEHNVTAAVKNPFLEEPQSILMSAFIGEDEDSAGIKQMRNLANVCPKHAPAKGFFLVNSPERIQTLKGLFRMASGASGFCPSCLALERPIATAPETRTAPEPETSPNPVQDLAPSASEHEVPSGP